MKAKHLITFLFTSALLSSCTVDVDITKLSETPKENEEQQEQGEENHESENQGEGEETPDENEYKVNEEFWNENILNMGMFSSKKFEVKCYSLLENEQPEYPGFEVKVDDDKYHINSTGNEKIYKRTSDTTANSYIKENDNWVLDEENVAFNYKEYFEEKTVLLPIAFSSMTYNASEKTYTSSTYLTHSNHTLKNIKYKFDNNIWVSLEYDVEVYGQNMHVLNQISNWGNVIIVLP